MSLSGNGLISTAVSANETTTNGTENLDWNDRCYAYVQEDVGLDVCHQESFQTKDHQTSVIDLGDRSPDTKMSEMSGNRIGVRIIRSP